LIRLFGRYLMSDSSTKASDLYSISSGFDFQARHKL
jgi:hypothetical protein